MARFFIAASNIFGGTAYLSHDDAAHIKVLRIRPQETFTVCDGNGRDYTCVLSKDESGNMTAKIIDVCSSPGEPDLYCSVYTAFSKGDKTETVIQKSVELGASEIVLFPSARCVSTPDGKSLMKKLVRWQRISEEAAKQSGRGIIPQIRCLPDFASAVDQAAKADLPLFLYENERETSLRAAVSGVENPKTAAVLTGPEGGFDKNEADYAVSHGMLSVTIGPRILRCETAPVCAVSALMLLTGNMEYK